MGRGTQSAQLFSCEGLAWGPLDPSGESDSGSGTGPGQQVHPPPQGSSQGTNENLGSLRGGAQGPSWRCCQSSDGNRNRKLGVAVMRGEKVRRGAGGPWGLQGAQGLAGLGGVQLEKQSKAPDGETSKSADEGCGWGSSVG